MDILPVWEDQDDIRLNMKSKTSKLARQINDYDNRGKSHLSILDIEHAVHKKFDKINKSSSKQHKWAENSLKLVEKNRDEPELNKFLKSSSSIIESKRNKNVTSEVKVNHNYNLEDNSKSYIQCKELNSLNHHRGVVTNVCFSQFNADLVCTSGKDRMLYLYKLNKEYNCDVSKSNIFNLSNYFLTKDMPILTTNFISEDEILITGRRKHYFTYNVNKNTATKYVFNSKIVNQDIISLEHCFTSKNGDYYSFTTLEGDIYLFDGKSKQYRDYSKINGSVTSMSFSNNSFLISSNQGEIYIFDIRKTSSCVKKFDDEGSYNTLNLEVSPNHKYLATSSITGIVNLYEMSNIMSGNESISAYKVI